VARKLVQLVPDSSPGKVQLIKLLRQHTQALLKANKPVEATKRLRELAALQPDDFEIRVQLGVALVRAGDFPSAATALNALIRAKPDYLPAYDNLSYVLAQLGRLDEAEQTCLRALEINPNHQAAKKNLALIRRKKAEGN
jgi:Flp pilus assembly protein TadD